MRKNKKFNVVDRRLQTTHLLIVNKVSNIKKKPHILHRDDLKSALWQDHIYHRKLQLVKMWVSRKKRSYT